MSKVDEISNGALFADLQVSMTEIFLIHLFDDDEIVSEYRSRLNSNCQVRDAIKAIMRDRFSRDDVIEFLENGYPRRINLDIKKVIE